MNLDIFNAFEELRLVAGYDGDIGCFLGELAGHFSAHATGTACNDDGLVLLATDLLSQTVRLILPSTGKEFLENILDRAKSPAEESRQSTRWRRKVSTTEYLKGNFKH